MKDNKAWWFLLGFILFISLISCSKSAKGYSISKVTDAKNGWLASSIYQMSFNGKWDRKRYYPAGEEKQLGKVSKTGFQLREEAMAAIISRLNNSFYEELMELIRSKTASSDEEIERAIFDNFQGVKIKKRIVERAYSIDHDAYLLVRYEYPNLRTLLNKSINGIRTTIQREQDAEELQDLLDQIDFDIGDDVVEIEELEEDATPEEDIKDDDEDDEAGLEAGGENTEGSEESLEQDNPNPETDLEAGGENAGGSQDSLEQVNPNPDEEDAR